MGVSLTLFRVHPDLLKFPASERVMKFTAEMALPFGSQQDILGILENAPGFKCDPWDDDSNEYRRVRHEKHLKDQGIASADYALPAWATVRYEYEHRSNLGRVISYHLSDDPVICIGIKRAYLEDFWPILNLLRTLKTLALLGSC